MYYLTTMNFYQCMFYVPKITFHEYSLVFK